MSRLQLVVSITTCIVMVLVAVAPLTIAGTHEVVKGGQGPRASAVTWEFVPPYLGEWSCHIVNNGLRSLVVDIYDITSGTPDQISHQRIRFAASGAYPTGAVDTARVIVSPAHRYSITVTPNGPMGASCTVEDAFTPPPPSHPVAVFSYVADEFPRMIQAGAFDSYDPDGTIVSYDWTFGDGAVASGVYVTHTYAELGNYTVTLTVTDNDGLTDSCQEIVKIGDLPKASFTYTTDVLEVTVNASSSYDPDGTIVAYYWDFGDGGTGSGLIASHEYQYVDHYSWYTIKLTVTDNDGMNGMAWQTVGVCDFDPVPSLTFVTNGFTVSVDASGSWDDVGIVSYALNWGDGTLSSNITETHTYAVEGWHTISLTVTDTVGQTGTCERYVVVPPLPVASFTYTIDGSTVNVNASGSGGYGGIVSYDWDWGDGTNGTGVTASHTYVIPTSSLTELQALSGKSRTPPHAIWGYTYYGMDGNPLPGCNITITNVRTGEAIVWDETRNGWDPTVNIYSIDLAEFVHYGWHIGDILNVTACKGTLIGWSEAPVTDTPWGYDQIDVVLHGEPGYVMVKITLTVTDTLGRTSTMIEWVEIPNP